MKKAVVLFVLVIAVCVVGGAFYTSSTTQKNLNALKDMINANPGYNAKWVSYDKGLFSTHAEMALALQTGAEPDLNLPIIFDLKHGPLMMHKGLKQGRFAGVVKIAEAQSDALKKRIQAKGEGPFWQADLFMSLSGRLTMEDRSLPIEAKLASNNTVSVDAYQGKGVLLPSGQFTYEGGVPSLRYQEDGSGLLEGKALNLIFAMDLSKRFAENMMPGSMSLKIGELSGQGPDDQPIALSNVNFGTEVSVNDALTLPDMRFAGGFDRFKGLGENIEQANMNLSFKNISVKFLESYQQVIKESMAQGSTEASMIGMKLMGSAMSDLLPHGPVIEIQDSGFLSKDGRLFMKAKLQIPEEKAKNISSPFAIIGALDMVAEIKMGKSLAQRWAAVSTRKKLVTANSESETPVDTAELDAQAQTQAQMQLDMMVIQKVFVDDGENYSTEINFKDGKVMVNGQAMPIPFF